MSVKDFTATEFDKLQWAERVPTGVACRIQFHNYPRPDTYSFAWSNDGIGCFWYDTLEELKENH